MSNKNGWPGRRVVLWALLLLMSALYGLAPVFFAPRGDTADVSCVQKAAALELCAGDAAYAAASFRAEDARIPGVQVPGDAPAASAPESPADVGEARGGQASGEVTADTSVDGGAERSEEAKRLAEEEQKLREMLSGDRDAYHIKVNRAQNAVTVYEKDEGGAYTVPVRAMVCSTGEKTPLGDYNTSRKYEWRPLFGGVYGQYATRIVGNILFHSVPYTQTSKDALAYEEYNKLGTSASMGCIRLSVEDAKWLYDYCAAGTLVTIYEDEDPGPLGKPEPLAIDVDSPNRGWDPTDPDPENPWLLEMAGGASFAE